MLIALQGGPDSFHELAAKKYYQQPLLTFIYCDSFASVFERLAAGDVDRAFVAVHNSNHGAIESVKRLLASYRFVEEGRHGYAVRQHLIGLPTAKKESVSKVISHAVALSQCRQNLAGFAFTEEFHDTAAAVELVRSLNDPAIAALGSHEAAERYGMKVLQENLNDDEHNYTVFVSLTAHESGAYSLPARAL